MRTTIGSLSRGFSTLNNNITYLDYGVFRGCESITTITIPGSIEIIKRQAFENCTSLESVVFNEGLTTVSSAAFAGCTSLTSISLPLSLSTLENRPNSNYKGTFSDCSSLKVVSFSSSCEVHSIPDEAFSNCTAMESISLPTNLTAIGTRSFNNCSSLTSLVLPTNLQSIGIQAFLNAKLSSLTSLPITPPTLENQGLFGFRGTIYVPAGSVEAYKTAQNWNEYASRIQAIPE